MIHRLYNPWHISNPVEKAADKLITLPSEKIRYTTILKAKGLEWDGVFLVCDSTREKVTDFQIFIGALRAKVRVYLLSK